MDYSDMTRRLAGLGAEKWAIHVEGRKMAAAGKDIIQLTIGEPEIPPHSDLVEAAVDALRAGRTRYSDGQGEIGLRRAIAAKYSVRSGREVIPDQVLCLPGTQAALFVAMLALAEKGDEVAVPDPYYATYEGVVRASGATVLPVATSAENGFRLTPEALEAALTPQTRVLLLNNPQNPTGMVMGADEVAEITRICAARNIRIISDEVYEHLIFDKNRKFVSPFDLEEGKDISVVVSSISKSHAAPGFRSGWLVASQEFAAAAQPIVEMMLFGNQPFIADATQFALTHDNPSADIMREAFLRRASMAKEILTVQGLSPVMPQAGMFLMCGVEATGLDAEGFARSLLQEKHVSVMPGTAFGSAAPNHLRISLTVPDDRLAEACRRIADHAAGLMQA